MTPPSSHDQERLSYRGDNLPMNLWCMLAAFGTYFCAYGFRKPFTAAAYDAEFWGISYKTTLVTAQVLGYTVSKFLGIKFVAEAPPRHRAAGILGLIGLAETALLLFAVTPAPYSIFFMFLNGLPLGMVFGLVLGFLEGRRQTEAFVAGLCASFIVADGAVKSVGAYVLAAKCPVPWMPCVTGGLFVLPLLLFVWMLTHIPAPSVPDVEARSARAPMDRRERRLFFTRFAPGLVALIAAYLLVTVLRSLRADFAPEIWSGLGLSAKPETFATSELFVAAGVLLASGMFVAIPDNSQAFRWSIYLSAGSLTLLAVALLAQSAQLVSPFAFMVLMGLGLYVPYVTVHTTVFERLISMTRNGGNIGYLMYLADAWGYLGYVAVMLARGFLPPAENFLSFFTTIAWLVTIGGAASFLLCGWYFSPRRCQVANMTKATP